jgi:hypothetical protein
MQDNSSTAGGPTADSAAALARAVALMEVAGREHTLVRAGRRQISLALGTASVAAWGYAAVVSAMMLHAL